MDRKKIRFIVNPKSGTARRRNVPELVDVILDKEKYDADIVYTQAPGHGTELAREAAKLSYAAVVAVGGDGSVNEVANGIIGTPTVLGIIPAGSGNGMSRHLGISMNAKEAMREFNSFRAEWVDTLRVNDRLCVGTMGVGFDAHVAHLFAQSTVRGYATYVKLVLREFYKYRPVVHEMTIDGQPVTEECFLLTFANSSQFGNNAIIAPFADVTDGLIDVSVLHRFRPYLAPHLIFRLMTNTLHHSRFFKMWKGRNILLRNTGTLKGHIDGEPVTFEGDLHVKVVPASLCVALPAHRK